MIKTLTAQTSEIDDAEAAVFEILEQLGLEHNLKKNSVGIIACYLEFIDNGIVKSICERLPFPVAGINTMGSANAKGGGLVALSLSVLTSDDVFFSAGVSGPLRGGHEEPLKEMYGAAAAKLPAPPSLVLAFNPVPQHSASGDDLLNALDKLSGGAPIFGVTASDFDTEFRTPLVMFGGEAYQDSIAVILMSGAVKPRFTLISLPEERTLKRKAVVTSAEGNVIKEINGMPAIEYGKIIGLIEDGRLIPTHTTPFMLYSEYGIEPVARAVFALTPEGYLLMGGSVPEGCTIGIGSINGADVLHMASKTTASLGEYDFCLVSSCISRLFILEWDGMAEINLVCSALGENAPFLFVYTAGEMCPVRTKDGNFTNMYHNLTLTSCAL